MSKIRISNFITGISPMTLNVKEGCANKFFIIKSLWFLKMAPTRGKTYNILELNQKFKNYTWSTAVTISEIYKKSYSTLTLSARSGTTVPNFFVFFAELCVHATLLIIVRSFSNLRCWIVHHLSFLEKKTELIYLHYWLFYNCSCFLV